ncbi:S8 family serine peptidase [Denitrobacterium detoxificans]|uniref:S8 family serine peptidase n=1 Tax=Denitrobacterium detoxificans TaxID=79604 RepID=UPI0026ED3D64|nr:S8 family serine peptidase [Denitrobacterium detoxificans]MBE6466897.1 hypothetical protein [Denitrobacterium detoxificans]
MARDTTTYRRRKRIACIAAAAVACVAVAVVAWWCGLGTSPAPSAGEGASAWDKAAVVDGQASGAASSDPASAADTQSNPTPTYELVRDDATADLEPYMPSEVMLLLGEEDAPEEVSTFVASMECVQPQKVTQEDIDLGFVVLHLAEGYDVPAAVSALETAGRVAQPDYCYYLAEDDGSSAGSLFADSSDDGLVAPSSALLPAVTSIDDSKQSLLWGLSSMAAYEAWDIQRTEGRVVVAVLDSGCRMDHEDLADNIVDSYMAVDAHDYEDKDYIYDVDESSIEDMTDILGHGTHVAGIVAGVANNGKGVAGVSYNAGLMPVKVFYSLTETKKDTGIQKSMTIANSSDLVRAYAYIASYNAEHPEAPVRVVNMSLGGSMDSVGSEDQAFVNAMDAASAQGILSVGAAGNDGTDGPDVNYPSDYGTCLGVINVTRNTSTGVITRYTSSNYNTSSQTKGNSNKNICAPGTTIYSTVYGSTSSYGYKSGTSMACPYVAGVAALLYARDDGLSVDRAKSVMYATATDLVYTNYNTNGSVRDNATAGWDPYTGYGLVNAYHALQLLDIVNGNATLGGHSVIPGESCTLTVPYDGDGSWTWVSSNPSVAGVTQDGVVTGYSTGSVTITATFSNEFGLTAVVTGTVDVRPYSLSDATIDAIASQTFTGSLIMPSFVVRYGGAVLTPGVDYSVSYMDNVNAGQAVAVATGLGQYAGSVSAPFTIAQKDLSGAVVTAPDCEYAGQAQSPAPTVVLDGVTLRSGVDYTVGYNANVNVGTATVSVTGKGNYKGTATGSFNIVKASLSSASVSAAAQVYTGAALTPVPTVSLAGKTLAVNTDFTVVSYADNVRPGLARVTVQGAGNYEGQASGYFVVMGLMDNTSFVQVVGLHPMEYAGSAIEPDPVIGFAGVGLTRGVDYQLSYANNVDVGEASMVVSGLGPYYANQSAYAFRIAPATLSVAVSDVTLPYGSAAPASYESTVSGLRGSDACGVTVRVCYEDDETEVTQDVSELPAGSYALVPSVDLGAKAGNYSVTCSNGTLTIQAVSLEGAQIALPNQSYAFAGAAIEPEPQVTIGGAVLQKGVDYAVSYADNELPGVASVTVTGVGNYEGSAVATFDITGGNIADATVQVSDAPYTGSAVSPEPVVTFRGKQLTRDVDYTVSYANNVAVGQAAVTIAGIGNFLGSTQAAFQVTRADISGASVTAEGATYTGSAITSDPVVVLNGVTLTAGSDYTVSYGNNVAVGTATVYVTGAGSYAGTATGTFTISKKPSQGMYRLYNPNGGEHFYTASSSERDHLRKLGWRYEGIGWNAPTTGDPVYRLYNPNGGDHHYTKSKEECDGLRKLGWRYEGVGWYSDTAKSVPLYRQYNPNAKSGSHNYTTSKSENDMLVRVGWRAEGIGWYGV